MKKIQLFLIASFLLLSGRDGFCQNWQLVWQDEFTNGISPDWVFETGTGSGGWGNNELQYYRRNNATVEDGKLVITARRENYNGSNYTSARLKTQGRKSWKYGKIEARIALPSAMGLWPAFWMLGDNISSVGWPACGEIDIMEHVNNETQVHGTIHWQDHNGNYANYGGHTSANVTTYHTYSVEWDETAIKWFLDGAQYHEVNIANGINGTSEFHNNFFILLNLAVGGNWPGFTIDNSAFPARMLVDYVRVYKDGGGTGTPPVNADLPGRIEAESYSAMSGVQTEDSRDTGGGQNVGWIDAGDWMVYPVNIPSSGTYTVQYRVASPNGGGRIQLDKDAGATILGAVNVPATGGWQNWTTVSHTVTLQAGQQNLGLYTVNGGYNLNWIHISKTSSGLMADGNKKDKLLLKEEGSGLLVFPNPTENELGISHFSAYKGAVATIVDESGKEVWRGTLTAPKVDVSSLSPGLYLILIHQDGKSIQQRFLKK